jgi:NAD(P)-dependent dehydrogenase (short-subunit alcohol dehydrogenase family)
VTTRKLEKSSRDDVRYHVVDLTDEAAVTKFYAQFDDLFASVHLVGAFDMSPVVDTSLAAFRKMFDANAVTCFLSCREAVRAVRRAAKGGGRIVNVAARPAVVPVGGMIAYSTSKAAVASITQSLAAEVKDDGILRQRRPALDDGHARQPRRHAGCGFLEMAQGRAGRAGHPLPRRPG